MKIDGEDVKVGTQVQSLVFDYEFSTSRGGVCRGDVGQVVRVEPDRIEVLFYPWGIPTVSWWTQSEAPQLALLASAKLSVPIWIGGR